MRTVHSHSFQVRHGGRCNSEALISLAISDLQNLNPTSFSCTRTDGMSSTRDLQRKRTSSSGPQPLTLELSPTAYIAMWFFIVVFHTACGTFLICVAVTYWFLTTGTMPFYVSDYSLTGTQYYHFYGFAFGMVGGMHGIQLLRLIFLSFRSRKFTFQSNTPSAQDFIKRVFTNHGLIRGLSSRPSFSRIRKRIMQFWYIFFSHKGLFGVESEHFSTIFALREVLEVGAQTYQGYRASILLPRVGLNALVVALLIANCWSTAATEYFLRKTPALERAAALTCDALISFGIMTVVPLMIFVPYMEAFDIPNKLFKNGDFLYDPVAITKLVLENRLIFASGLFDFGTKLIPQLSIFLSLVTISELVTRGDVKVIPGATTETIQSVAVKSTAAKPDSIILSTDNKNAGASQSSGERKALLKYKEGTASALFFIWGSIVLILHALAAQRASHYKVVGCRAITRPWFSNGKEPCSSLVYDCHAENVMSPNTSSFDRVDPAALSTLAIVHCPALVMPPDLQRFTNLAMIHIYNSTIVDWNVDSSISATEHTRLLSVLVGKSNMTEFPQGLLQPLPATMLSVQFSETNLTKILDDLYLRWHFLTTIVFENGILTEIPYQTLSPSDLYIVVRGEPHRDAFVTRSDAARDDYPRAAAQEQPAERAPGAARGSNRPHHVAQRAEHVGDHNTGVGEKPNDGRVGVRHAVLRGASDRPRARVQSAVLRAPRDAGILLPHALVRSAVFFLTQLYARVLLATVPNTTPTTPFLRASTTPKVCVRQTGGQVQRVEVGRAAANQRS
ncbi:unnamed protein product [Phytophthora fragariaefolia]|uniref:Unnamed protein product n=1 Tax=Phytophthora fragariaefolia TaxID=1490495 RepID=A0A9W6X126_9STRA|nr:unnamed protein product [Phytophthora fragariaefolia]